MRQLKWFSSLIVLGLLLVFTLALLSNRFPISRSPRIVEMRLVTEKLPEDRLLEELRILGSQIEHGTTYDEFDPDLMMVLMNGRVLAGLNLLFHQTYGGEFLIDGRHSRTPQITRISDPMPDFLPFKEINMLLLSQMRVDLTNGRQAEALETLSILQQFGLALIQNPSMVELMMGLYAFMDLNGLILENHLLLTEDQVANMPSTEFLMQSLNQAFFQEMVLLENLTLSDDLEGGFQNDFKFWGARFLINREQTVGFLFQDFRNFQAGLKEGTLNPAVNPQRFNKMNPLHLFFNPIGRILVEVGKPDPMLFQTKVTMAIWQTDALRLLQDCWAKRIDVSQETSQAAVMSLNLNNPVTLKPYEVDVDGKLILLPQKDSRYAEFNADSLKKLERFPVSFPSF